MIESIAWPITLQEWVTTYFVVGAIVMTALWSVRASKQKTFANELATIMRPREDEDKSALRRFLERGLIPALALLFGWLVWPAMLIARVWVAYRKSRHSYPWPPERKFGLGLDVKDMEKMADNLFTKPHDRVILAAERTTCVCGDEIESVNQISDPAGAMPALPFGHLNGAWLHLKKQLSPGRDLWQFSSERVGALKEFKAFEGYAVFDGDTYVDHMVTGFVWNDATDS
jgi:hypothetical protein